MSARPGALVQRNNHEPDKVISVACMLIDNTTQDSIKYDALRCLADAYKQKGDMESASATIEQIPEFYFSKLSVAAWILTGKEKREAAEKEKGVAFESLLQMMGKIAECCEADGNISQAIDELNCALQFLDVVATSKNGLNRYYRNYVKDFEEQIKRLQA